MPSPVSLLRFGQGRIEALGRAWSQFWFQSAPTNPLELARIEIGAAMLMHYGLATPYLFELWGDAGWLPRELLRAEIPDVWTQSVLFYLTSSWQLVAFHFLFLFCTAAFMVGWRTSWVKWIVLIGQISYDHRNPMLRYGVDKMLACLLFILCLAPIGHALALDRVRALRAAKRKSLDAMLLPYSSVWAGACTRLMQIQMACLFFYSGIGKLRGEDWWDGNAIWWVFASNEYYNAFFLNLLASNYWIVNVATYGTIVVEIAYPFLIWQRSTRPYLMAGAIFLHLNFFFFMGLFYFSFIMIMGHMSFVRPEWLTNLGAWWKRMVGDLEMIYDGRCGFCVRSMAWFLAFDGLAQIRVRDFRTDPSPLVSDAEMEKALYLVLPDGRAMPGFEAYRYVVLRVPGLWWQIPLFYIPIFSRLIGRPAYNWIAANRGWLSSWGVFAPVKRA